MTLNALMAGSLTTAMLVGAIPPIGTTTVSYSLPGFQASKRLFPVPAARTLPSIATEIPRPPEATWLGLLNERARRMSNLKPGWDGPGSVAISEKTLFWATSTARSALSDIDDVISPQLVPGGDGSVQLEWHEKHGELEFDIGPSGEMAIWIRDYRNGAEFDAENEAALALFYRWAPWIASKQRHDLDEIVEKKTPFIAIAA